jgi:hypothetical protein
MRMIASQMEANCSRTTTGVSRSETNDRRT